MSIANAIASKATSEDPWFESLMVEVSTRFMRVSPDGIDSIIEEVQRLLCERLELDRSTLWQPVPENADTLELTHVHQASEAVSLQRAPERNLLSNPGWIRGVSGFPPVYARMDAASFFPWTFAQIKRGRTVVIHSLDDLPPEAALDREVFKRYSTRSNVCIPLHLGQERLGCLTFVSIRTERRWPPLLVRRLELVAHLFTHALGRKSAVRSLRENDARMKAILHTAVEGIITIDEEGFIESANPCADRMFGYDEGELAGHNVMELAPERQRPDDARGLAAYLRQGVARMIGRDFETTGLRKDGTEFPMELSVIELELENRRLFTGFARDITARRQAGDALRESERRFRIIADSAPVLIWMCDSEKSWYFFNKPWLAFTGRSAEQESGSGWLSGIHPEDRPGFVKSFHEAFDRRAPFQLEYRLRHKDGGYRWLTVTGVPRFDTRGGGEEQAAAGGPFQGYIGSCTDITQQKETEKAARDFSGRLIRAQEDERARLARELHDDISQRLARAAIDIGCFARAASLNTAEEGLVQGVRQELVRLGQDVHALSYQLHPSVLVDLGLEEALQSECDEFSRRESVAVQLKLRELPAAISREAAICLFRIAQEGLRNAVRHGRADRIEVSLRGMDEGLQLAVHDNGCGFDPSHSRRGPSLGIASMRERARLLNGDLDIESEPGAGTTVIAWVPLTESSL